MIARPTLIFNLRSSRELGLSRGKNSRTCFRQFEFLIAFVLEVGARVLLLELSDSWILAVIIWRSEG